MLCYLWSTSCLLDWIRRLPRKKPFIPKGVQSFKIYIKKISYPIRINQKPKNTEISRKKRFRTWNENIRRRTNDNTGEVEGNRASMKCLALAQCLPPLGERDRSVHWRNAPLLEGKQCTTIAITCEALTMKNRLVRTVTPLSDWTRSKTSSKVVVVYARMSLKTQYSRLWKVSSRAQHRSENVGHKPCLIRLAVLQRVQCFMTFESKPFVKREKIIC